VLFCQAPFILNDNVNEPVRVIFSIGIDTLLSPSNVNEFVETLIGVSFAV
jgi:hypothetical protein